MNLLEEAKIRYPVNSKIIGVTTPDIKSNMNCGKEITLNGTFSLQERKSFSRKSDAIYAGFNVYVYSQEIWAEITHYAIPEKWCIKVSSGSKDYPELSEWRAKSPIKYKFWDKIGYIHSNGRHEPFITSDYTEIRIEDFIKYIYKGETKNAEDPKYVKCIKNDMPDWMHGEVGKYYEIENWEFSSEDCKLKGFPNSCNRKRFTPATEEEYLAQNPIKENVMEDYTGKYIKAKVDSPQCTGVKKGETIKIIKYPGESIYIIEGGYGIDRPLNLSHWELVESPSLVGRWLKCIAETDWSYKGSRPEIGEYVKILAGNLSDTYIHVENMKGESESFTTSRITNQKQFELMPEGFNTEQTTSETILDKWLRETKELNLSLKELTSRIAVCDYSEVYIKLEGRGSDSKAKILYDMWNTTSTIEQAIPEYVECINDVACSGELSKGKIYKVIEHDGFEKTYKLKDLVCPRDVSRFKPSTKESYDRQEYVVVQYGSVDITFGDSYTAGLGDPKAYTGKIPKLHMADEAGQWVTDRFIGKTWVSERGISTFWPIKFDTYKPEKKQIKIIELPKVKKRFVY